MPLHTEDPMETSRNPYSPGAGNPPPELAGRQAVIEQAKGVLERTLNRRMTKSLIMLGLRGVGKTVLLNEYQSMAEDAGCLTTFIEAEAKKTLPVLITPKLWQILLRLDARQRAKDSAHRAVQILRGFASAFSVKFDAIEVGVTPEAMTGDLSLDLTELLLAIGRAAAKRGTPVVILIDEVQYLTSDELGAVMVALHRLSQKQLPVLIFGAGLPQLARLAGEAKSYAERLFSFVKIGRLSDAEARQAIVKPLADEDVAIQDDALDAIVAETGCYPYFVQLWAYHAWECAETSPILPRDVSEATVRSVEDLDQGFFNVRLQRLSPRQRDYAFAMAELGEEPMNSTAVAESLGVTIEEAAPVRRGLIEKGVAYSPDRGFIAFTVPKFAEYLLRIGRAP